MCIGNRTNTNWCLLVQCASTTEKMGCRSALGIGKKANTNCTCFNSNNRRGRKWYHRTWGFTSKKGIEAIPVYLFFNTCRAPFSTNVSRKGNSFICTSNCYTFLNGVLTDPSLDSHIYRLAFEVDRLQHFMHAVALVAQYHFLKETTAGVIGSE